MSVSYSSENLDEIKEGNLEYFLLEDEGFVDFFNSFLALPCFAARLHYNSELEVFEEFIEKIADVGKGDAKVASQLRQFTHFKGTIYNVADNQSRIGYYVTILDKVQGLEFVKKRRLPLFLRSELYAEYKLSKQLSAVQESFFRGLYSESSDEDEDSGVEEPNVFHPGGRSRSVVSFNLAPSLGEAQSTDGEAESDNEGHMYLPTNVRSIEETFDAWHESFKRPESRTSLFSSGGGSPQYPLTPQIREEDEFAETRSSSSCYSAQESDVSVSNNARPASRRSIVSDNTDKTPSPEPRSGVSSASRDAVAIETGREPESFQEGSNIGDQDFENCKDPPRVDEMTRSLSSALSFIAEHGQVRGNAPPPEKFVDEPLDEQRDLPSEEVVEGNNLYTSKEESTVQSQRTEEQGYCPSRGKVEENGQFYGKDEPMVKSERTVKQKDLPSSKEVADYVKTESEEESIAESKPGTKSDDVVENASIESAITEREKYDTEISEPPLPAVNEIHVSETDERRKELSNEGKVPSINVEIMCSDDGAIERGNVFTDTIVDLAESVSEGNSESIPAEELHEELSEATEDLSNAEETIASVSDTVDNSGAVEGAGDQDAEKQEIQTLKEDEEKTSTSDEGDCLHCKKFAKQKNSVPIKAVDGDHNLNDDDSKQSNVLDLSSETGETTSVEEHSVQKTTENESIAEETGNHEVSASTVLEHDAELKAEKSTFSIGEEDDNEEKTEEKDNESEVQDSRGDMVEDKEPNEDDADEEGGYTTEASATTLQGIRGVFGKKRRCSTAATSVDFDVGEAESAFSENGSEMREDKPYDLAMKEGFDSFKEFLLETSGEKLLQFWLEVECGRYLDLDEERNRLVQCLRDKFWRSGGIYEFSAGTKSTLNMVDGSTLTYERLFVIQPDVLEPLLSYWCIRFTMHQQRRSHCRDLDYNRLSNERPKSCVKRENALANLPQVPAHVGLSQVLPSKTMVPRPQTSGAKKTGIQHQTSRPQVRAKSAHPRLLQADKYMHTNASTKQLQNIIAPVKTGYGFEQPPAPSFPVEPTPDYLPTVRLFINPVPSPDSKIQRMMRTLHRTAVFVDGSMPTSVEETGSKPGAMLDSLIQGLIYERQTGNYFNAFLQNSGNKLWMNCLEFWKSLQEYNAYFFADSLNPSLLSRKAGAMYANFVVSGSAQDVHVHRDIQLKVHKELEPPYEELFDAVEEHVLYSLLEPWNLLIAREKESYTHEVPTEQRLRHIEVKVMARRRQSLIPTPGGLGNAEDDHEKERISVEEANRPVPVPKDGITFEALIRNRDEVEHFKEFLNKKHARGIKDLMAWTDMETFLRVPRSMEEKRDKKAREIRDSWLGKKYFFGPDSPATREGRNLIMNLNGGRPIKERPQSPVILESQKFVRARIERRWLMLFKQTTEFLERQKPRTPGVPEMVEDIMLKRRLQRSEAAWKILNSRWVSSSRDVVALRQTLLNPRSCSEFTAFVAVKGDTLESNVHFWLEVQKFKDLCHAHAQPTLIQRKVQTIVDCFLNSAIAPELQIDIPIEMADKLMERLLGRSPSLHPYVFREAQMTVFRVLFNHWKEFVTHRSKIPEGEDPREHFAEILRRHRADNKSKKEASERRRMARLSAERKKKEKEEREKKRMEDLASLFSMESTSIFYSEEDDLRSWFYSKHLVEQERQEHIKRLREQGIIIPEEELVEEKEDTKSRRSRVSMAKSSSLGKKVHDTGSDKRSSEGSSRISPAKLGSMKKNAAGQLSPSLVRRGSGGSTTQSAVARRNSGVSLALSRKDDKTSIATMGKDEKGLRQKNERKSSEIQVIPIASPEPLQPLNEGKLLPQRPRSSKRLLSGKQPPKSAAKKGVPLDAISCISDYSVLSNIDFQPRNTPPGKQSSQGGTSLLTSKSLMDFTNSPEGAQLSMPLPLVRITSASHVGKSDTDGSVGDPSPLYYKPRPLTQSLKKTPIRPRSRKGLGIAEEDMQIKPDVIVN